MKWLDKFSENSARSVARQSSRRGFIAKVGTMVLGGAAIPLLPVVRKQKLVSAGLIHSPLATLPLPAFLSR